MKDGPRFPSLARTLGLGLACACATALLSGCTVHYDRDSKRPAEARLPLNDPVLNARRVFVVEDITPTTAAETIRQLLYLDAQGTEPIDLWLMTPGGDLKATFAIVHTMHQLRSRVRTTAIGECNSGGAVLLAAGTSQRCVFPDSAVVIHGMVWRNHPPAQYQAITQDAYNEFWRTHARLPDGWLPLPPGSLHVLSAREAVERGVADVILPGPAPRGPQPTR